MEEAWQKHPCVPMLGTWDVALGMLSSTFLKKLSEITGYPQPQSPHSAPSLLLTCLYSDSPWYSPKQSLEHLHQELLLWASIQKMTITAFLAYDAEDTWVMPWQAASAVLAHGITACPRQVLQARCQHVRCCRRPVSSTYGSELPGVLAFLLPVWRGILPPAWWLLKRIPVSLEMSSSFTSLECNSAWPKHLFEHWGSRGSGDQGEWALNGQLPCVLYTSWHFSMHRPFCWYDAFPSSNAENKWVIQVWSDLVNRHILNTVLSPGLCLVIRVTLKLWNSESEHSLLKSRLCPPLASCNACEEVPFVSYA